MWMMPLSLLHLRMRLSTFCKTKGCSNRIHKFASNRGEVIAKLPPEDLSKELKNLDLDTDDSPVQRSLGLNLDLDTDSFTFRVSLKETPFTRRGVL